MISWNGFSTVQFGTKGRTGENHLSGDHQRPSQTDQVTLRRPSSTKTKTRFQWKENILFENYNSINQKAYHGIRLNSPEEH